ncbi:Spermidine synthase-like protein [Lancefieldella parvula DSM 20469]|uniref:Spermidine synthase-like protein n=1 Tax=Lancefieldella parvula (strain ATCC 33793 / DSM 20469 / CCUG 32760 / JCM 10300 / KCTC 3663 / VPI 0546 / 1246) TaxID=521095 RepID=C8W828_LANP1|nr:fused MFS/spermidine synthase [Lancefieldella parvula]ACV51618.1 Spermidine synthase-like protein [Lancefieldella parvula DSM 20469]
MVLHDFWTFFIWSTVAGLAVVGIYQLLLLILRARGVFVTRTKFGLTMIFDSEDEDDTPIRLLNVNGAFQSVSYIAPKLRFELCVHYHRLMAEIIQQTAPQGHIIVMGGGGFSLPKHLATHMSNAVIDAIEIDPKIVSLAREHFFLDEALAVASSELRIIEDDAWKVLQSADAGSIDVLVNEVFAGRKSLGPLGTVTGAQVVKEKLASGGVYLADVRCPLEGRGSALLHQVSSVFAQEFAHVAYVPEWPNTPKTPGNNLLIATDADIVLPEGAIVVK